MHALKRISRRARTLCSVYYALMIAYRGEIFLWAVATSLPLIMMGVWTEAGASGAFPIGQVDMARYFIAVFLVRQLTIAWVIYEFEWYVVSGRLSPLLLQPMDPVWRWLCAHVSEQFARLPFCVILMVLCFVLYPKALWGEADMGVWLPAWWQCILAIAACYLTFLLRFMIQYCIAMLAFWFERAAAFERVNFLPYLFLSGLIAPMEVYTGTPLKDAVREIAMWTPYPYMFWFPAKLLVDGDVDIAKGFAVIAAWLVIVYIINRWLWKKGLRHYSAMGA